VQNWFLKGGRPKSSFCSLLVLQQLMLPLITPSCCETAVLDRQEQSQSLVVAAKGKVMTLHKCLDTRIALCWEKHLAETLMWQRHHDLCCQVWPVSSYRYSL